MRAARPRPITAAASASAIQSRALVNTTGPRRAETIEIRSFRSSTAAASGPPSVADGVPGHRVGNRETEPLENGRGDVGRRDQTAGPGRIGGQVPVEPRACDSDREPLAPARGGAFDRDQQVISAEGRYQPGQLGALRRDQGDPGRAAALDAIEMAAPLDEAGLIDGDQRRVDQDRIRPDTDASILERLAEQAGNQVGGGIGRPRLQ